MDNIEELERQINEEIINEIIPKGYTSYRDRDITPEDILRVCEMISENKEPKIEVFIGNYAVCNKLNCVDKTLYANGMYIEYSDKKDMKDYIEIYKNGKFLGRRKIIYEQ